MTPDFMESPLSQIPPADPTPSAAVAPTGGETPRACDHTYAEHSSRYDLRCVLCGASALDSEDSDLRMLAVWEQWAEKVAKNHGAARLFARVRFAARKAREDQLKLRAALSSPVRAEPTLDVQACRQTLGTIRWLASQPLEAGESADGRLLAIVGEVDARLAVPADSTGYDDTIRRAELAGVKRIAGVVRKLLTDEQRATLAAWLDPFAPLHEFVATLQGASPPVRAERGEAERIATLEMALRKIASAADGRALMIEDFLAHTKLRSAVFSGTASAMRSWSSLARAALTPTPPATPTEPTDA